MLLSTATDEEQQCPEHWPGRPYVATSGAGPGLLLLVTADVK
jgi:hypothetical protein